MKEQDNVDYEVVQEIPQDSPTEEQYSQQFIMPANREQADLLKYVLNPKEILDEIERNFRALTIDYNTGQLTNSKNLKPMVNDTGIHVLMSKIEPYVSKIVITGILSEKQINDKMILFGEVLSELLATHFEEFGIDIPNIPTIRQMMMDSVHITMTRAKDGAFNKLIQQVEKRIETYAQNNQTNRSFLANLSRKMGI